MRGSISEAIADNEDCLGYSVENDPDPDLNRRRPWWSIRLNCNGRANVGCALSGSEPEPHPLDSLHDVAFSAPAAVEAEAASNGQLLSPLLCHGIAV